MFSPLSTTLIYGTNDAVLVDPPLTTDQAASVGDWIKASGKNVTHIVATHGHGDHWFTAGVLADRLDARVVASRGTIEQMHNNVAAREAVWDKAYPGQIPPSPVTATTVTDNRFTLEGHDLVIVEVGHSDTDHSTVVHVPDLSLVVAGDVMYNGAHQYLAESADGGRDAWRNAIDRVRALRPRRIVASHRDKNLDDDAERIMVETRQYLDDADDLLLKARDRARLLQRHARALPRPPAGRDHTMGRSTSPLRKTRRKRRDQCCCRRLAPLVECTDPPASIDNTAGHRLARRARCGAGAACLTRLATASG